MSCERHGNAVVNPYLTKMEKTGLLGNDCAYSLKTLGLTTCPYVHWLAIWVLSQHLWGQIPRSSCKTCKYRRIQAFYTYIQYTV